MAVQGNKTIQLINIKLNYFKINVLLTLSVVSMSWAPTSCITVILSTYTWLLNTLPVAALISSSLPSLSLTVNASIAAFNSFVIESTVSLSTLIEGSTWVSFIVK